MTAARACLEVAVGGHGEPGAAQPRLERQQHLERRDRRPGLHHRRQLGQAAGGDRVVEGPVAASAAGPTASRAAMATTRVDRQTIPRGHARPGMVRPGRPPPRHEVAIPRSRRRRRTAVRPPGAPVQFQARSPARPGWPALPGRPAASRPPPRPAPPAPARPRPGSRPPSWPPRGSWPRWPRPARPGPRPGQPRRPGSCRGSGHGAQLGQLPGRNAHPARNPRTAPAAAGRTRSRRPAERGQRRRRAGVRVRYQPGHHQAGEQPGLPPPPPPASTVEHPGP